MKSEERHKLQQNELADYLVKAGEKVKPYQNAILGGIILVLVAVLFLRWWNGRSAEQMEAANTEFYTALNNSLGSNEPSELIAVADKYSYSPAAALALLTAADIHLNNGCDLLFKNKTKAKTELGYAAEIYTKAMPLIDKPFLKAKANFGLGRAEECQNKLADAKTHYEAAVKIAPDGPFGVLAANRLADLNRPATKENYDKFAKRPDPKPFKEDPSLSDKMPLFDPSSMPNEPLIKSDTFGEKLKLDIGGQEKTKGDELPTEPSQAAGDQPAKEEQKATDQQADEEKTEAPKAEEAKPTESSPATPEAAKPAEGEKPAAEEKPATPPPAQESPAPAENK